MNKGKIIMRTGFLSMGLCMLVVAGCSHTNSDGTSSFRTPWSTLAERHHAQLLQRDTNYLNSVMQQEGEARYYVDGYAMNTINSLTVAGDYDLVLQPTSRAQAYVQVVNPNPIHPITFSAKDNALTIAKPNASWKVWKDEIQSDAQLNSTYRPQIIVRLPNLSQLQVGGQAVVTGQLVSRQPFTLIAKDKAQVNVQGMTNLQQLSTKDSSKVILRWVNSQNLTVNSAGRSQVELAGTTQNLMVKLNDKAQINSRYLRAQQGFIQTRDSASASILVTKKLRAFAYGRSNIYYFKYVSLKNEFKELSGNVMQVDWQN